VAKLSSGEKVELVAVTDNPNKAKVWWRPDGTLIDEGLYETLAFMNRFRSVRPGSRTGRMVPGMPPAVAPGMMPGGMVPEGMMPGMTPPSAPGGGTTRGRTGSKAGADAERVYDFIFRMIPSRLGKAEVQPEEIGVKEGSELTLRESSMKNVYILTASFQEKMPSTSIQIGRFRVPQGEWETLLQYPDRISFLRDPEVDYSVRRNTTVFKVGTFEVQEDYETRLVAVDNAGKTYISSPFSAEAKAPQPVYIFYSTLPIQNIKEFRIEKRRFEWEWVVVHNVSLVPRQKTDVTFTIVKTNKSEVEKELKKYR